MTDQPALFEPALATVALTAFWVHPSGWALRVTHRREGAGSQWSTDAYDDLTTAELLDVAQASLWSLLGESGPS